MHQAIGTYEHGRQYESVKRNGFGIVIIGTQNFVQLFEKFCGRFVPSVFFDDLPDFFELAFYSFSHQMPSFNNCSSMYACLRSIK
mgnify:CR=1 FL=1